jgi:hypothetical protein
LSLDALEENGTLSEEQSKRKIEMKAELFDILENEELYWYRRSHETWLLKRTITLGFFHRVANGRKRKQTIFSLKEGDREVTGNKELLELTSNYCKSLFGPGPRNMFDINSILWQPIENVSSQKNEDLTKTFLEEEIRLA